MAKDKRPSRGKSTAGNSDNGDRPERGSASSDQTGGPQADKNTIKLDPWQEGILEHKGHFVLCTGRQVGKTFTFSRKAGNYMIENPGARIIVVSLTEDQAQLIIVMILTYLEQNFKSYIKKPYSRNVQKGSITLNNGSKVIARPVGTTGDAVRGFTGDVLIIDEASKMPESVFTASKPTLLTTGGQIWMCSTPFGKKGYFYESFLNKHDRFKVFHISSEEVIHERPISNSWSHHQREESIRFLNEEKADMTKSQYGQEYMGIFQDDLNQLYSDELIEKLAILSRSRGLLPSSSPYRDYFLGVDLARMGGDLISYQIMNRRESGILHHVESINEQYKLTTHTYDKIIDLNRLWDFNQIGIDAGSGSLGVGISDFLLREPSVRKKIVDLNNREVIIDYRNEKTGRLLKEMMYFQMLVLMEQNKVFFLNDDDVRLSLKSIQYEYIIKDGAKTRIKIFGSGSKKIDHIAEGLVRAVHLANSKHLNLSITWM